MKMLILNGSPKLEASDTMHLTRAFVAGMNDVEENQIHTIHVIDKHIEYCTGCFTCKKNGGACIHDDDMREILEEILDSDLLILSFGLYGYGMPGHLKTLIDRTMPVSSMAMEKVGDRYHHIAQRDFSKLRYLMICGCGFPNSKNNFEPMVMQFKLLFPNNSTIITIPESPMFNAPEAVSVTKPFLEIMRQAGWEYVEKGEITADTRAKLSTPMIPEEVYAQIVNGSV